MASARVQELAVYGGIRGDRKAIYHAVMLDPLTGAVGTLDEIRRMTDDLCAAEEAWLPQFQPCGGLVHSPCVMMAVLAGAAEPAATGPVSSRTPGCGGWHSRW
jgi:hypothetical protein